MHLADLLVLDWPLLILQSVVNQLCIMLVTSSEEQSGIAPVEVDATGYVYQVFFFKG